MYCKNCDKQLSGDLYYCLKRDTKPRLPEKAVLRNRGESSFFILAYIVIIGSIAWIRLFSITKNSYKDEGANITVIEAMPESHIEAMGEGSPSLIDTWRCEAGEVIFTERRNIMMGKGRTVLGGGWLKYEVVDDSTLYPPGGDMPVGINMKYEKDGDFLGLGLNGGTTTFYKE